MKKLIILMLCTLLTTTRFVAQTFEGEINYTISYISKNPKITSQQMNYLFGDWMSYCIKGGTYKSTLNGKLTVWQLYLPSENRLYTKTSNTETVFWNDASLQGDEVLKSEFISNSAEVLGYKCDEVVLTCKSGIQRYFFNKELAVDAEMFKTHKYGNWYDYLKLSGALPLKSIVESPDFTMTSVAKELKPKKMEDNYFKLPYPIETAPAPR